MIKRIIIPDIKRKYINKEIRTSPLQNNIFQKTFSGFVDFDMNYLSKVRIDEYNKIWGKPDFKINDRFAWTIENNGCKAILFSGEGKGTLVEIILNEKDRPLGSVKDFLMEYLKFIKFLELGNVTKSNYDEFVKNPDAYLGSIKYNL